MRIYAHTCVYRDLSFRGHTPQGYSPIYCLPNQKSFELWQIEKLTLLVNTPRFSYIPRVKELRKEIQANNLEVSQLRVKNQTLKLELNDLHNEYLKDKLKLRLMRHKVSNQISFLQASFEPKRVFIYSSLSQCISSFVQPISWICLIKVNFKGFRESHDNSVFFKSHYPSMRIELP